MLEEELETIIQKNLLLVGQVVVGIFSRQPLQAQEVEVEAIWLLIYPVLSLAYLLGLSNPVLTYLRVDRA